MNKKGMVTARKKGTAIITAKYKGKKYTAFISVKAKAKHRIRGSKDEYCNPNKLVVPPDELGIYPYHIYYRGDELWVECYVYNGNEGPAVNINILSVFLYDFEANIFAEKSFGELNTKIPAMGYVKHTFVFEKESFTKTDLRNFFYGSASVRYDVLDPE